MHNTNDCDLREQKPANARAHLNEKKQTTEQKQNLKKKQEYFLMFVVELNAAIHC